MPFEGAPVSEYFSYKIRFLEELNLITKNHSNPNLVVFVLILAQKSQIVQLLSYIWMIFAQNLEENKCLVNVQLQKT